MVLPRSSRPLKDSAVRQGVATPTAYGRLASMLREQIISGELRPGDQLPTEPDLSAAYNVGRNTAREALRVLASHGLVTSRRGVSGGTFVAIPGREHVQDSLQASLALMSEHANLPVAALVEIREMLEVPAAELAAVRHTEDDLTAIYDTLFDPRTVAPGEIFATNREFHVQVLAAAHNPALQLVVEPIFGVLRNRFRRDQAPAEYWQRVDRDHREIVGYLAARDQSGVREATHEHLQYIRATYERMDQEGRNLL